MGKLEPRPETHFTSPHVCLVVLMEKPCWDCCVTRPWLVSPLLYFPSSLSVSLIIPIIHTMELRHTERSIKPAVMTNDPLMDKPMLNISKQQLRIEIRFGWWYHCGTLLKCCMLIKYHQIEEHRREEVDKTKNTTNRLSVMKFESSWLNQGLQSMWL